MNDYYSVRVDTAPCNIDITDLAASYLGDVGFESFEPDATGLTAYVSASVGDGAKLAREALAGFPIEGITFNITSELVPGQDWNEEWEKNYFKPILIGGECVIHSSFHTDVPEAHYDIVIDPKMAFGTGHHDTTSQMVRHILDADIAGRSVIDMGTGTGILGILAAMRGASQVTGIEIDEPAYDNAVENVRLNGVGMRLIHGDAGKLQGLEPADYFMANINRNVITADMKHYTAALKPGGKMFLSGFYEEDIPIVEAAAAQYGLHEKRRLVSNRWAAIELG